MLGRFEHASEDDLERYTLGTLGPVETELLEEHLLVCAECQERLQETDDYVKAVRDAAILIDDRRHGRWRQRFGGVLETTLVSKLAWAAGVLSLALALAWLSGVRTPSQSVDPVPVAVVLRTARGVVDGSVARAPSGRPLVLEADLAGLAPQAAWTLSLVNASGGPVFESRAVPEGSRVSVTVPRGLAKGAYWVRLYAKSAPDQLIREYALRVE